MVKQNEYQKVAVERINSDHAEYQKEIEATHAFQKKQNEDLNKQENLEDEKKEKIEETTVTDLFKSIQNEDINKKREAELNVFVKKSEQKVKEVPKAQ